MAELSRTTKMSVLVLILIFPSAFYILLIQGEVNFAHLPYLVSIDEKGAESHRSIPAYEFTDQNGNTFSQDQVAGKIHVADFFFTRCPSICPIMTENLKKIHGKFKTYKDFAVVSHTVDPAYDTPEVLKEYANRRYIDSDKWYFVTGEKEKLYRTAYHYMSSAMKDSVAPGGFLHTEYFILVDKEGRIRCREDDNGNLIGVYDGTNQQHVRDLIDDIKVLMAEYQLELKKYNNESYE
jgi:protein SCO1/2